MERLNITLATRNLHKLREFQELACDADWLTLQAAPSGFDPEETGSTFEENATIKARAAASLSGLPAVADDSGIYVDALEGAPGVISARYCEGTDADRRAKLLKNMENVPESQRKAHFFCAIALVDAEGKLSKVTTGTLHGRVALAERGSNGFGYDAIFYLPELDATAAEISSEQKNKISHRAQAWRAMLDHLAACRLDNSRSYNNATSK